MAKTKIAFYGYPSEPPSVGETVKKAANALPNRSPAKLRPWQQLSVSGKLVIEQVLQAIRDAHIFAADLTYPNFNVMFELGYAMSLGKRLWISRDRTIVSEGPHLGVIRPDLGYAEYANHQELAQRFVEDAPWADLKNNPLTTGFTLKATKRDPLSLLYLKQPLETDASLALTWSYPVFVDRSELADRA